MSARTTDARTTLVCYPATLRESNQRRLTVGASRTYTVILEPAEEGGYIVHVPALPEIVTEGDTEAEALAMAKDAIELVVESRHERGEPVPKDIGEPLVHKLTVAVAA
jgi:antitoxin HicB